MLRNNFAVFEVNDIDPTPLFRPAFVASLQRWPIKKPSVKDLLGGWVYKNIFGRESKTAMVLELGRPCFLQGFFFAHGCAVPVFKNNIVMK